MHRTGRKENPHQDNGKKPKCPKFHIVPLMEGLGLGFVANHFDVVPVRTNDESCIVVRMVLRA